MNKDDGIRLLKLAADYRIINSMKTYAGYIIIDGNTQHKKEVAIYLKNAAEKGILVSFSLYKYVFSKIINSIDNVELKSTTKEEENVINHLIKANTFDSLLFKNNNMLFLQHSTIPKQIFDDFLAKFQKTKAFRGIRSNLVYQNDPNRIYTFYFLSCQDSTLITGMLVKIE